MPSTSNVDINVSDMLAEQNRRIEGLEIQKVNINKEFSRVEICKLKTVMPEKKTLKFFYIYTYFTASRGGFGGMFFHDSLDGM